MSVIPNFKTLSSKPWISLLITIVLYFIVFIQIINLWLQYASLELYNYLIITPIVLLIIYTGVLRKYTASYSVKKLIFYITFYFIGGFLIFYSVVFESLSDQLIILGMMFLIQSVIILFTPNKDLYKALLLSLTLLIMIPLPQGIVYELSAILTRLVLVLAIPLTRYLGTTLKVTEQSGYVIIHVLHNNSYVQFEMAPVCSGVIGLFSVIAVAPLIIYASLNGTKKLTMRVIGGILGVIILTILMFIANVIRLTMVFYFTSLYGFEVGYNIFHYTPEIVLVLPIVFIVVKILDKLSGNVSLFPSTRDKNDDRIVEHNKKHLALIPIILLIPIAFPIVNTSFQTPKLVFINTTKGPIMLFNVTSGEKELFIPPVFQGVSINYTGRQYEVEKGLGPTHRIHVYRAIYEPGKLLDIYVEFSTKPSIHIWELCLWWQNITVHSDSHFIVSDPSGKIIFSAKELSYGNKFMSGYLVSWRYKYYTEKGIEPARFTIMINAIKGVEITERDKEFVKDLAKELILKSIDASYAKYSKNAGFEPNYFLFVIIPFGTLIVLSTYLFEEKKLTSILRQSLRIDRKAKNNVKEKSLEK